MLSSPEYLDYTFSGLITVEVPIFSNGLRAKPPNIWPGNRHYFYFIDSNKTVSDPETLSLSSKVIHYTNILESDNPEQKIIPLLTPCAKHGRPMENGLPNTQ